MSVGFDFSLSKEVLTVAVFTGLLLDSRMEDEKSILGIVLAGTVGWGLERIPRNFKNYAL